MKEPKRTSGLSYRNSLGLHKNSKIAAFSYTPHFSQETMMLAFVCRGQTAANNFAAETVLAPVIVAI